jgi:hypothetical protein
MRLCLHFRCSGMYRYPRLRATSRQPTSGT